MRSAMFLLYFVAGSAVLCMVCAEDAQYEGHSRHTYPNPMTQHSLCRRQEKSYICDPNSIISVSEGLLFHDFFKTVIILHVRYISWLFLSNWQCTYHMVCYSVSFVSVSFVL